MIGPFPNNASATVVVVSSVMIGVSGEQIETLSRTNFNDDTQKLFFLPARRSYTQIPKEMPRLQVVA
jgi:hypothetical protein